MTQENKLTEPVQVGLWYQTKAGVIVNIESDRGCLFYANNDVFYDKHGGNSYAEKHNLIKCLGADPFNQVTISKTKTPTPTLHDLAMLAALTGLLAYYGKQHTKVMADAKQYADEFMRQKNQRENG